ncbi:MAG TPA: isoprenylcysteine carboxylmethyltransferase family protein [Caulobacteraceae bacterium]|jgi:protein-S-isoprenylcysteine O-methyltransferase
MEQRIWIPPNVLWVSYGAWFAMELWVMSRDRRRFAGRTADKGSFFGFMIAIPAALIIAFQVVFRLPELRIGVLQPALSWAGIGLIWVGMAFRLWAIQTLGAFFRTSVVVQETHQLVTAGPYRWLRHPAYTGSIASLVGLGLALGNWASLAAMVVLPTLAIAFRIHVEERALTEQFGASYEAFRKSRPAILPLVW